MVVGRWEGGKVGVGGKVLFGKVVMFFYSGGWFGGEMGCVVVCFFWGVGVGQQTTGYTLKKDVGGWLFFCFFSVD